MTNCLKRIRTANCGNKELSKYKETAKYLRSAGDKPTDFAVTEYTHKLSTNFPIRLYEQGEYLICEIMLHSCYATTGDEERISREGTLSMSMLKKMYNESLSVLHEFIPGVMSQISNEKI